VKEVFSSNRGRKSETEGSSRTRKRKKKEKQGIDFVGKESDKETFISRVRRIIVLTKDELKAKKGGKKIIDYLPFLIAEIREQHTDLN